MLFRIKNALKFSQGYSENDHFGVNQIMMQVTQKRYIKMFTFFLVSTIQTYRPLTNVHRKKFDAKAKLTGISVNDMIGLMNIL